MPYAVNADLPPSVRSHLPEHAQDIFREAFNHAHAAHAHDPGRRKPPSVSPGRR
jgi:cation transport regulator